MGRKRKSGRSSASASKSTPESINTSKYNPEETFADSRDEFFSGKDKVLLEEGPSRKRRKKLDQEEEYLQPSDEEVLGYEEDELEDDQTSADNEDAPGSEEEDGAQDWGTSKADYYNADVIETEADAIEEEAEARRLQQKQLQNMTEADFGFDESQWAQTTNDEYEAHGTVTEKLPDVTISEDTPSEEREQILKSRYPELAPLVRDFADLQDTHKNLTLAAAAYAARTSSGSQASPKKVKTREVHEQPSDGNSTTPVAVLKWRALSTYLGSIAMYLAIMTAPASGKDNSMMPVLPNELREHPVMQTLLRTRQAWDALKDIEVPDYQEANTVTDVVEENLIEIQPRKELKAVPVVIPFPTKSKKAKKSKQVPVEKENPVKKSKSKQKATELDHNLAQIDDLIASVKNETKAKARASAAGDSESDFGDEIALTAKEAAEKAQRKKGLRFYSSQIAQKANRRGEASRDAGGDADLPYKERLKDRQARLMREAEKRGGEKAKLTQRLDYQDGSDGNDEEDARVAREVRAADEDGDGYYDMIAHTSKQKKADKAARAAAYTEAAKVGGEVYVEDKVGPDGKRAITYEIQKNKGLMPRRKKEVRNPRVKKRMKYDEKMKKLGSVRQVWKGGEGKGGYGGELTGIKTNLVRSVKL